MAQRHNVGSNTEAFKRWLTHSLEQWLLILDNADDPLVDISLFFPVGNRGTIIITTRNPQYRIHATVGSRELGEMNREEAITLLLRASGEENTDENPNARDLALPIVNILGCLALAVAHAGALIMQNVSSLSDYCSMYLQSRKRLLEWLPEQAKSNYEYTVYSTLELSLRHIEKMSTEIAKNALDLLKVFGFCHFDDISEQIFSDAWRNIPDREENQWWLSNQLRMLCQNRPETWDPLPFREAVYLLASYSLIRLNGVNHRIYLHPLVHSWIRDSLSDQAHKWWTISISTLSMAVPDVNSHDSHVAHRRLNSHIRSCLSFRSLDNVLVGYDQGAEWSWVMEFILYNYHICGQWRDEVMLAEKALEYSKRVFGVENNWICNFSYIIARSLNNSAEYHEALQILEPMVDVSVRVNGVDDHLTLGLKSQLLRSYDRLNRSEEALEFGQNLFDICKRYKGEEDSLTLDVMERLAFSFASLTQIEEAIRLSEESLKKRKLTEGILHPKVLESMNNLALLYTKAGRRQEAFGMFHQILESYMKVFGEEHPYTLIVTVNLARTYDDVGRLDESMVLLAKAIDISKKTDLQSHHRPKWEKRLQRMRSKSADASKIRLEEQDEFEGAYESSSKKPKHSTGFRQLFKSRRRIKDAE